jgi:hypothetical protein
MAFEGAENAIGLKLWQMVDGEPVMMSVRVQSSLLKSSF